jgi:hypothetical protein
LTVDVAWSDDHGLVGEYLRGVTHEPEAYRVKLPFTSRKSHRLNVPVELPGAAIAEAGSDYLATLIVKANRAENALAAARSTLADILGVLAVRGVAFIEVHDARRLVGLVDPVPITEGPVPPFDSVGGGITEMGAEFFDPIGERRRARRVVNFNADLTLTRGNLDKERQWLELRQTWPNEVRRAVALIHAAEVSSDPGVAFVLAFSVLEVLTAPSDVLLPVRIPDELERREFLDEIRLTLKKHPGLSDKDVDRLINSASATHVEGPIPRFYAAFHTASIEIASAELEWVRMQRGNFVHPGRFDGSPEASSRRDAFRRKVATLLESRLDGLQPLAIGN